MARWAWSAPRAISCRGRTALSHRRTALESGCQKLLAAAAPLGQQDLEGLIVALESRRERSSAEPGFGVVPLGAWRAMAASWRIAHRGGDLRIGNGFLVLHAGG